MTKTIFISDLFELPLEDGLHYVETFRVFPCDFAPGDTISVTLSNSSKEYYDFMQLRLNNRLSFMEYLIESINYPPNIKGGKGFFNLYVPDIRLFVLELLVLCKTIGI